MERRAAQTEVMLGPLQGHPQPHSEASGLGPPQLMALKQFRRSQGGRGSCSRTPPLRGLSSPASTSQKRHPGVPVTPTCPLTAQSGCRQSLPEPHTQNPRSQLWSLKPKLSLLPISHLVCLQMKKGLEW
ncbi:uncharacterized protein LOC113926439 isoform X1 [Zalophus californianus]|uniref:Uncharacterized protein LOC113926439 isoform X1 n=1 Tax=Zalophus californianus TaxID=9704 RepID=A0A6J2DKW4_ZALCA|nr:uncharacterized protein LOC113926439 isoform X1 [Zalophus californianus]